MKMFVCGVLHCKYIRESWAQWREACCPVPRAESRPADRLVARRRMTWTAISGDRRRRRWFWRHNTTKVRTVRRRAGSGWTRRCRESHPDRPLRSSWTARAKHRRIFFRSVTGPRSPRIAHRQSLWLADMWHAYWAASSDPSRRQNGRIQSKWRRRSSD